MKISIITVCYNSETTIRDTIESVLSQDYMDIEYIIVDALSNDKTMDIVGEYNNISKIISEPDQGIYDAMNKGVRNSTGEIIGILNSDDFFETTHVLSNIARLFQQNQSTSVVFGDLVYVNPGNLKKTVRFYSSSKFKPWKLRFGWMPPHPTTFIKRDVYEKYGLYNLTFSIASDFELFVRMLYRHKLSYIRVPKILVRMRTGGVSTSGIKNSICMTREIVRACKINGLYTNLFFILTKIPFKLMELLKRP